MKILIVDDNRDNLELLSQILERKYDLFTADNGLDGIRLAKEERPDLAILDLKMKGMDGYELLDRLNEADLTDEMFVIFLTARFKGMERVIKGYEMGIFDYLIQPIEEELLLAKIRVVERINRSEKGFQKKTVELKKKIEELASLQLRLAKTNEMLNEKNRELETNNNELARFNKLFVNRELRIKKLKQRVGELEKH